MANKNKMDGEMLKGTLDMMILRTLVTGDAHGHTIAKVIERTSEDVLEVDRVHSIPLYTGSRIAPAVASLKRSVWVTVHEVMKPPKLQPPTARRLGSLMPWLTR